jgi:hypothetical protein
MTPVGTAILLEATDAVVFRQLSLPVEGFGPRPYFDTPIRSLTDADAARPRGREAARPSLTGRDGADTAGRTPAVVDRGGHMPATMDQGGHMPAHVDWERNIRAYGQARGTPGPSGQVSVQPSPRRQGSVAHSPP